MPRSIHRLHHCPTAGLRVSVLGIFTRSIDMTTPYALPPPIVTIVHGFTPEQMQQAFKDGAASRDAEIAHLKQELQIE